MSRDAKTWPAMLNLRWMPWVVLWLLLVVGCASPAPAVRHDDAGTPSAAVLVDFYQGADRSGACTGVLVAPRVVLTAAHCARGADAARVTAPRAKTTKSAVAQAVFRDDGSRLGAVGEGGRHDVALVVLRTPIALPRYAKIQANACPGCTVVHVGRSRGKLFVSRKARTSRTWPAARPNDMRVSRASSGAGGPVLRTSASGTSVVGVMVARNAKSGVGYASRVDSNRLQQWVRHVVASTRRAATTHTGMRPQTLHVLDEGDSDSSEAEEPAAEDPIADGEPASGDAVTDETTTDETRADDATLDDGAETARNDESDAEPPSSDDEAVDAEVAAGEVTTAPDPSSNDEGEESAADAVDDGTEEGSDGHRSPPPPPPVKLTEADGDYEGTGIRVWNPTRADEKIETDTNYWSGMPTSDDAIRDADREFMQKVGDAAFFVVSHGVQGAVESLPPRDVVAEAAQDGRPIVLTVCDAGMPNTQRDGGALVSALADSWGVSRDQVFACTGTVYSEGDCEGSWVDGNGTARKPSVPGANFTNIAD